MGSARLSGSGQELLALLAGELKTLPNALLIEGHTDATPYSSDAGYSNWELSADRANAARRLLQQDGVRADQVTQVRGYADQLLRVKANPYDPSNRRISILVKNDAAGAPAIANATLANGKPAPANSELPQPGTAESHAASPAPPAKSETGATAPTKPGFLAHLKGLLPGHGK
jgi:chemotaxis protein MotB